MRHFTSIHVNDLQQLLKEALEIKNDPYLFEKLGRHKNMFLLFFNSSLRTRISAQRAAENLGMKTIVFNINEEGWKIETELGVVMDGEMPNISKKLQQS